MFEVIDSKLCRHRFGDNYNWQFALAEGIKAELTENEIARATNYGNKGLGDQDSMTQRL